MVNGKTNNSTITTIQQIKTAITFHNRDNIKNLNTILNKKTTCLQSTRNPSRNQPGLSSGLQVGKGPPTSLISRADKPINSS